MSSYTVKGGSSVRFSSSMAALEGVKLRAVRFPPADLAAFAPVAPVSGVDKSQNTSWVSLSACPSCQMRWMLSTQRLTLLFGSSGRSGVDDALVKPQLAPVRGDLEHIVRAGVNKLCVYPCGALGQLLHHLLCIPWAAPPRCDRWAWAWEVELVGGLDIRRLPEQVHELRQIERTWQSASSPGSPSPPGPARWRSCVSPKGGSPAIEVGKPLPRMSISCWKYRIMVYNSVMEFEMGVPVAKVRPAAGDFVDIPAF